MSLKVLGTLIVKGLFKVATFFTPTPASGSLWLWGYNNYGAIGDDTNISKSSPVQTIASGTDWKNVACGQDHTAAIKTDGTLWTWGRNYLGSLGDNTSVAYRSSPVQTITEGTNWIQLDCGSSSTAAIKTDGTLWLWGQNNSGQLGDNTITNKSSPVQTVCGGTNWKQVSCDAACTAAIKTDGTLWLWGLNLYGGQGNNTNVTFRSSPVQTVAGGTNWKQVSLGTFYSAAIKTDGTLWTWGHNSYGQLGDNTITDRSSPVQTIAYGTNWKQVSCGGGITAAIKTDGTLWTWGRNNFGQVGDNTITNRSSPVQTIAYGTNWKQVSCGYDYTTAIKTDGTLWTWGKNYKGVLGDNTIISRSSPIQTIAGGNSWIDVSANYVIAAIYQETTTTTPAPSGSLWSWGLNSDGQLGDNTITKKSSPVQTIAGGNNWISLSKGFSYRTSAAIKSDGTLWLWGDNDYTQGVLGDNTTIDKSSPVQTITYGTNWKEISCGHTNAVAIKNDGTLWNWGSNQVGQLGDGTNAHKSSPVQTIAGGTDWKQASAGGGQTAAIKNDGTLWLWGYNFHGQLGDNTSIFSRSSPVQTITGGTNWKQVFCGNYHTAAIKNDGTLWTWGNNNYGQLGDSTTTNRSSPIQTIAGGSNWKYVCAGYSNTLAVKTDGTLWAWGVNFHGQLGDNTAVDKSSPVQTITFGTTWQKVTAGTTIAAIKTDGTLWTWGKNLDGALGDNTTTSRSSPVQTITNGNNWIDVLATESVYGIRQ